MACSLPAFCFAGSHLCGRFFGGTGLGNCDIDSAGCAVSESACPSLTDKTSSKKTSSSGATTPFCGGNSILKSNACADRTIAEITITEASWMWTTRFNVPTERLMFPPTPFNYLPDIAIVSQWTAAGEWNICRQHF
jgi:hypothetical protein